MLEATLIPFFALLHTLGALVGTGTTTFAEFFYTKAAADGVIDHHERKYLRRMYRGLHIGITLTVLSAIALMVLEYFIPDAEQDVLVAPFWAIQILTLIVLWLGILLSRKQTAWWFASAAILAGWWMMLLLDLNTFNAFSFISIAGVYVAMTAVFAGVLTYARKTLRAKNDHTSKSS